MIRGKTISAKEAIRLDRFIVETTFAMYSFISEEDTDLFSVFEIGRNKRVSRWTRRDVLDATNFKFYQCKKTNITGYS